MKVGVKVQAPKLRHTYLNCFKTGMPQNVANTQNNNDKYLERFKLFLLEATEFYQDLIKKIKM